MVLAAAALLIMISTAVSAEEETFDINDISDPQKTVRHWLLLKQKFIDDIIAPPGTWCNSSVDPDVTIAMHKIHDVFQYITMNSPEGILRAVWTWAEDLNAEFAPLVNASNSSGYCDVKELKLVNRTPTDSDPRVNEVNETLIVCYKNNCTLCSEEAINADGDLSLQCETKLNNSMHIHHKENYGVWKKIKKLLEKRDIREPKWAKLSWEEILEWKKSLENEAGPKFALCEENPYKTVAAQIIWQLFDDFNQTEEEVKKVIEEFPEYYDKKLGYLKYATKDTDFTCPWGEFCGPDGICIDCSDVGVDRYGPFGGACDWGPSYGLRTYWYEDFRKPTTQEPVFEYNKGVMNKDGSGLLGMGIIVGVFLIQRLIQ